VPSACGARSNRIAWIKDQATKGNAATRSGQDQGGGPPCSAQLLCLADVHFIAATRQALGLVCVCYSLWVFAIWPVAMAYVLCVVSGWLGATRYTPHATHTPRGVKR
jgi:hypothetical protein